MTIPNNEPQNPYTSGQPTQGQGQNQQYQQPQQGYAGYPSPAQLEGGQLAQTSMILGILSLFVVGIILGPMAISKANKAEREYNTAATVGKVTGWIGTILAILWIAYFIFLIIGLVAVASSGAATYGY